jgi:PKD repeat protein
VRGSLGAPFRIVWADGNERQGSNCDLEGFGDYYSTAPPATAKNHITVGALNSNDDTMTSFSSWGPTDDGRLKPDVSGPGCQSGGDGGVTSANSSSTTAYTVLCGTSMASPTVVGCVALMLEDFRAAFPGLPDPRNSTVKALLAQTAVDLGNAGPDYQFGYGSVRVKDAIDFQRLGRFDEEVIPDQGSSFVYTASVSGGGPLKIMLAWDDVPGTPNVAGSQVNDLDLVVTDPSGVQRFPWTLDPLSPGTGAVRTKADHANNLEQVLVDAPQSGVWRIEVRGFDVPSGPQPFSLSSSHAFAVAPFVQIGFPDGLPSAVEPGVATPIRAHIQAFGQTLVAGSPTLFFHLAGSSFQSLPMTAVGPDLYEASIPAATCTAQPEFYVSAAGATSGAAVNPAKAPIEVFAFDVHTNTIVFADDFETDKGWTVTSTALTDGPWERAIPAGDGHRNDPLADFDGSGRCWLTDNGLDGDVDGGPTTVTSPLIDMSQPGTYLVRYAAWLANDDFDADDFDVELSFNGGASWTPVESLKNTSGWALREFEAGAFGATTSSMRVRFSATDNPNNSITEAALDAFEVVRVTCTTPGLQADFAGAPTSGLAPLSVAFTDLSTGGPILSWSWTFADGGVSALQHPSHTFQMPGVYTVSLKVTGALGSSELTKLGYINASLPPLVGTVYGAGSPGPLGEPTIAAHSLLAPGSGFFLIGGNLPPGTPAFMSFSLHQLAPPLALADGLVLNLNLPLALLQPVVANGLGEAVTLVTIPPSTGGATIFGQCFAVGGAGGSAFASSKGLAVTLP